MRGSKPGLGVVVAACVVAMPAGATHHKAHPGTAHHKAAPKHRRAAARPKPPAHHDAPKPAVAAGATIVPAGGIKLYCGPGKAPLMVRKMTQGAGTTVTVICR